MKLLTFHEFDAFAESIHGVESRMMFRNARRRTWRIGLVDLQGINVQLGQLGSGNIAQGGFRADEYLVYLPLTDACEYSANGVVLDKHSFAILEPGCEFCISTEVEHDWCAVSVPTHMFAPMDDVLGPLLASAQRTVGVTRSNPRLAGEFRTRVSQVMSAAADCPQFESTPAAARASAELLKMVASIAGQRQASETVHDGRPRFSRQTIIHRCNELLEERAGERVDVAELASAAEVSERTLRAAFHEYYGVGPARYLQLMRLHRVRRALQEAEPGAASITDVLAAHGEWEFGRVASRYRRLFGELPSETLRGKQRRAVLSSRNAP